MPDTIEPSKLSGLASFDIPGRPRLVFGAGSSQRAGELASSLQAQHALLVTDPGIVAAGHSDRIISSLRSSGLQVTVFSEARENPSTRDVDACLSVARSANVDVIVGLGGGSAMDTAKGTNFLLTNGGRMQDYWGVGKASKPMLPLVAIPTTTGTGSEMQCAALIADDVTHQKMACLDPKVLPAISILDPKLVTSQPRNVAACTGLDAVVHAVETFVTTKRTPESTGFSREAFRICIHALPRVLSAPEDPTGWGSMQLGAAFAGAAIERSMLGAAHAAANPLTARFGLAHGHAVGLMLPHVVRFNGQDSAVGGLYSELAELVGWKENSASAISGVDYLAQQLEQLVQFTGLPQRLSDMGVSQSAIRRIAEEAAKQWTAGFNPRSVGISDFAKLYESAL